MLYCQEIDHEQSEIIGVCLNNNCSKQGLCCYDCIKIYHNNHIQDTIKLQEFINWKKRKQQTLNTIKDNVHQLQQCLVSLSEFINEILIKADTVEKWCSLNLTKEIRQLIIIEQIEKSIMNKISDIIQLITPPQLDLKQLQVLKVGLSKSSSESVEVINQKGSNKEKITINQLFINQKQQLNFTFSRKNKHPDILINFEGDKAKSQSIFLQTRYVCCDELITENSFARIKIECGEAVSVGVCQQYVNFQNSKPFEAILNGAYILNNEGIIQSYTKDNKYSEQKFCEIAFGDIIIIEVYMKDKKIIWINQKFNRAFNYNITDNVQGLYFIFGLTSCIFDSSFLRIL